MSKSRLPFLSLATLLLAAKVIALPTDPTVRTGSLTAERNGPSMTLRQQTSRAAADFASFDVAAGERVTVVQPSSSSLLLARVTGGLPTHLDGYVQANGSLVVANPHGVLVGASGVIETGSFAAVALEADGSRLDAGQLVFSAGAAGAEVVNAGRITVADAGLAALVGPRVVNTGLISARLGRVQLAGGSRATLDLAGDGFLQLALGDGGSVEQSGVVRAEGGRILITADAAAGALAGVVNVDGLVEASSLVAQGGRITLSAAGGTARVGGELAATSGAARGGDIDLSGGVVIMAKAKADVSGAAGGGRFVAKAAEAISAEGDFSARAGALGGDGGFVELSGRDSADVAGARVDTRALVGRSGTFLLDPLTVTVDATLAASIVSNLATTDYVVQADNSITVSSAINYAGTRAATLTLDAGTGAVHAGTITVSAAISSTASALTLVVDGNAAFNNKPSLNGGQIRAQGAAGVTLNSGSWNDTLFTGVSALTIGAATYTTSADGALDSLKLNNASSVLNGTGTLTLSALDWTSGAMSGAGTTVLSGGGIFTATTKDSGVSPPALTRRLDILSGATLSVRDTAGYSAGSYFALSAGGVINNAGTFEVLGFFNSAYLQYVGPTGPNPAGTFNNLATGVVRAGGASNTGTRAVFKNLTSFTNQAGTLTVGAANAEVRLDGVNAVFTGAGTGHLQVSLVGGSATFQAGSSLTALTLNNSSSGTTTTIAGATTIDMLKLTGTSTTVLTGSGTLTLNGLDWTAGTMSGTGITELAAGGTFTVQAKNSSVTEGPPMLSRRLDILPGATLTVRDTAGYSAGSHFAFSTGAVVNNAGTFEVLSFTNQQYLVNVGPISVTAGTFNNLSTGVVRGGSATNMNTRAVFKNLSAFTNQAGTLTVGAATSEVRLDNVGAVFSGAGTGHLKVSVVGGSATFQSGSSITAITLSEGGSGSTTTIAGATTIDMLKLAGTSTTVLTGSGTLTLNGLDWTAGTMSGTGITELAAGGTFTVQAKNSSVTEGPPTLSRRLDILSGATLTVRDTAGYSAGSHFAFGGGGLINNAGTFEVLSYTNQAYSVYVGSIAAGARGTFNNLSTGVIRGGSATNLNTKAVFSMLSAVNIQGGVVTVGASGSSVDFQNCTSVVLSGTPQVSPGVLLGNNTNSVLVTGQVTAVGGAGAVAISLGSGILTLDDGASVSLLEVTGGTVNIGNAMAVFTENVSVGTLKLAGGAVSGPGILHITEGLDWTKGTLTGTGCTSLDNTGAFNFVTTGANGNNPPVLNREFVVPEGATLRVRHHASAGNDSFNFEAAALLRVEGTLLFPDVATSKTIRLGAANTSGGPILGGVLQVYGGTVNALGATVVTSDVKLDARNAKIGTDATASIEFAGAQANVISGITQLDAGVTFASTLSNTFTGRISSFDGAGAVAFKVNAYPDTITHTIGAAGLVVDSMLFERSIVDGANLWVTGTLDWRNGTFQNTGRIVLPAGATAQIGTVANGTPTLNAELVVAPGATANLSRGLWFNALGKLRIEGQLNVSRPPTSSTVYMTLNAAGAQMIVAGGTVFVQGGLTAADAANLEVQVDTLVQDGILRNGPNAKTYIGQHYHTNTFTVAGLSQLDGDVNIRTQGNKTLSGRITSSDGAGELALLISRGGFTIGAAGLEVDSIRLLYYYPDYPEITGGDLTVTGNLDWTEGAITTSSGGRLLLPSGATATLRSGYVFASNQSWGNVLGRNMVVSPGATVTVQRVAEAGRSAFYVGNNAQLRVEGSLLFTSLATAGQGFTISPGTTNTNATGGSVKFYGALVDVQTAGAQPIVQVPVEVRDSVIKTVATSWFGLYGPGHVISGVNQLDDGLRLAHSNTTVTLSGTVTSADGPSAVALLADQAGTFTIGSAGLVIDALTFTGRDASSFIDGSGDIWVTRQLVAGTTGNGLNLKGTGKLYLVSGATGSAKGLGRTLVNEAGSTLSLGSVYTSSPFKLVNKGTLVVEQIQVAGASGGNTAMTGSSVVNEGTIEVRGTTDTWFQLPLFNAPSGQLTLASGATAKLQLFQGWLNQNTAYPLTTGTVAPGYLVSGTNPSTFPTAVTSVAAPAPVPAGFTTGVFTPTAPALVNPVSRVLAVPVMAKAAFVPDAHSSLFSPSILTISTAADSEAWTGGTFRLDSGSGTININTLLAALASGTPLTISSKGSIVFDTDLSYLGSVAGSLQLAVDTAAGNRQGFIQLPASLTSATAPLTLGFDAPVAVKSTGSTIATSGGAISFASPLGGGSSLALSAGAGAVSFASAATVGGFTSYAAATSGPITGLTSAAANTTFSGAQSLSGALSVTGGLTLSGGLTAAGAVSVSGQLAATGSASIGTVNGAITLNTVTGPGSLALSSGTAAINVAGDISSLGALSLQTAGATGNVTLSGTFDVGALNVLGGGQAVLLGGAQGLSSATSATFAAGVPVTLGDQSGDRFSFVGALTSPGATGVTGIVNAGSAQLGDLTLAGSVNTSGNLSTGTLTLAGDAVLGTGTGLLSAGAIAGATHALTLSSATGNVTVSGGVSQVGALTLQAVGSTGIATVSGVVDLGSLTVAGGTASLLGGNNGTSAIAGGVTVANAGVLSLGDQAGDTFGIVGAIAGGELRLAGGATASAASASLGDLRLGGILQLGGVLNASAVTLSGDSLLQAGGNITLASVTGAGHDLTVSAASANLMVSGGVSGVDVLTLLPLNSVSVTGSLAANTAILGDSISVGSAAFGSTQLSGDLSGTGGNISLGAVTLGADSSVLTAGGDLSLGSVTGNGYRLILDGAAGDVTLAGGISGLAMLHIQSATSTGDVTIADAVNLTDLLVQGSGSLAFLGGNAGVTTLSGNISLAQTGGLRFGDQAGDQFSLNPGDLIYAGDLTLGGVLSLPAGRMQVGSLSLAADASIVASGQVSLGSVAVVANGHDLTVTAGGLLAAAGVTGAGDLALSGALGQSLSGSYLAGGTIQLGAADTVLSGDVVLRAAEVDFTGLLLPAASPNAGSLAFEPAPATADMAIGGTASTAAFDLTAAEMALIGNGFTSLRFGSSAGSGVLTVAAPLAFTAPVSFVSPSGSLVLSSSLTTAGHALSIDAALRISGTASIDTTSGGAFPGGSLSVGSIQGAVAGPSHLTLDTGSASLTLGAVGNLTPLNSLTLASDGLTTVGQDIAVRDLLRFEGPVAFGASAVRLTADTIEAGAAASFVGASTELTLASASGLPVLVGASTDSGAGAFDVTSGLLSKLADLGSVRIVGGSAAITVAQPVTVGVPLVLATTGLTDISAAVGLTGDGALTVTGDLRLSGAVTGTGTGAIRVLGDLEVVANASLITGGAIQVGSAGTSVFGTGVLTLGGTDVDFLGSTGALTLGGLIVNAGDLTLGSSSADIVRLGPGGLVVSPGSTDLRLGQLYSAGDVTVGQMIVPGVVSLNLTGADFRSNAVDIAPPGSLTIRTNNGDAALGSLSASSGGGSLLVDAGQGAVSLVSASMSGPAIATVDITAGGGTLGPLRVAGDIDVTSTATSGAGPSIVGLGSVGGDIRLSGLNLSLSGQVATPGLITVSADMAVAGAAGALRAADVILTGSITPATASSVVTVAPYVTSSAITLGGAGTGGFHLSTADLASIGPGFASVIIGGAGQTGNIDVLTALAPQATLSLQTTGTTTVPYAVVTSGGAGFGVTGASVVSADITTDGGAIALLGATQVLTDVTFDSTRGGAAPTGADITLGDLTLVTTSPTANTFTIKAGANGDFVAGDIRLQNSTSADVQFKILSGRDVTVGELPDGLSIDSQATGVANGLPATGADPQLTAAARVLRIPTRLIGGVAASYQGTRAAINDQVSMSTQESTRLSRSAVSVVTVAPAASAPAATPAPSVRIPVVQGVVSWVGEGARAEQGDGGLGSLKLVDNLSVTVQGGNGIINYEGARISIGEGTVVRKSSAP